MSSARILEAPPGCGKRLLSHVIDERARLGHSRPFASIPQADKSYKDVSYGVFANAINTLAGWILKEIGPPSVCCESLVYTAPADLRYQILIMAAVKAGYVAFLISPRNSGEASTALLKECRATKLLTSSPPSAAVPVMLKSQQMRQFTIPSLEELLDGPQVDPMPLAVTWEEYRYRPFLQIHSSGSTGIPKLVTLRHGSFTAIDGFQLLEGNELCERFGNMRMCVTFPPFHIAGITYGLASPIWVDSTVVIPPAAPLTAELINSVHTHGRVEFTLLAPSSVVDLAKTPEYLKILTQLSGVAFAGGPLPDAIGTQIAQHTRLLAGYGASEWNAVPQLTKPREDWPYFFFNESQGGLEFRERDKGLYEMVICRKPEYELSQPVFVTFPDIERFESKDLFAKHPTKPGMWKYISRLDDIIVFSNGEKLNPITFEGAVSTSPDVKGCLLVGQGRFQAIALIEIANLSEDHTTLFEKIWPYIDRANEAAVRHGRVSKDCILFTSSNKPLPRAGKGTIQRASAWSLYAPEIDAFYERLEAKQAKDNSATYTGRRTIDLANEQVTEASLITFLSQDLGLDGLKTTLIDFFTLGMDSLQVVNLVRAINTARPEDPIDAKQVYDNPTVAQLAHSLHSALPHRNIEQDDFDDEELKSSWIAMDQMFKDLSASFEVSQGKSQKQSRITHWFGFTDQSPIIQPDGGTTAWLQVLAMFLVNLNNWGLVNSFGVFQAFYEAKLLSNHESSTIAWIGTLQGALLLLVGVISGPLFDKGYFKPTLVAASVGLVFAMAMLSLSTEYYQVLLSQGILCGICSGLLYIPSIALVPVYFKRHRGLALGIATGGGSIGGVLYPIIFQLLLVRVGFGWAVRAMALVAAVTLGLAVVLSKPVGARIRRQLFELQAFRERSYVVFLLSAFFLLSGIFVPYFLTTSFAMQGLHLSSATSFDLLSIINAAQFFGRVIPSWSSDFNHQILGPELYHFCSEVCIAILAFCWIAVHNTGGFVPWLILYGFFSGAVVTLPAVILPHISPNLAIYGTRIGMLYAVSGLGFLISTPIAAVANASSGGFLGAQLWTGSCCLVASLLFLITGLEVRERRLLYERGKMRKQAKGQISA